MNFEVKETRPVQKPVLDLYKEIVEELKKLYNVDEAILVEKPALHILDLQVSSSSIQSW